jgi:hypothetical protein
MKNIMLSADDKLIEAARVRVRTENTTLNEQFRRWLKDYVTPEQQADDAMSLIKAQRSQFRTGGQKFGREEMEER